MVLTQGGKGRWYCSAAIDCDIGFQADSDRYVCSSCGLTLCIGCLPSWRQYVQLVSAYRLGYYDMMKRLAAECEAPMYGACLSGRLDVVNHLVQEVSVDLETVTKKGRTAFSASCRVGNIDVVRFLREVAVVDIERANYNGVTPFYAACYKGHMDVVRYLREVAGVDIERASNNGATPFFIACQNGHMDVVRYLREVAGVDIERASNNGDTPFFIA